MSIIAFVFARGGSKGLPGKNVKEFAGKPLIAWSIEHARAISRVERIIVSTDSPQIADVALAYGAEAPFTRPAELAADNSPEWLSWQHALDYVEKTTGSLPEAMVSLPTTSPLRQPVDIENCLDAYEQNDVDMVITVTDAHRSPYFNMVTLDAERQAKVVMQQENTVTRRQDSPEVFDMTTVCYVGRPSFIMKHKSAFEGCVQAVHVPVERSIDIDTPLDFKVAECILKGNENGCT